MADVEVPDPDEVAEKAADPFARRVALFVAVYAVGLAVASLGGSNAAKEMVMAQQQATNLWAYYQAKVIRENLYLLEADKLELGAAGPAADPARVDALRDKYRAKAAEYNREKGDIRAEAEGKERERDTAARRDPYFDFAEVTLQVAIVLASVAMLSGRRLAFRASLVLAAAGLLLTANGFGLVVAVPGLE